MIVRLVIYRQESTPTPGKLDWRQLWIKVREQYSAYSVEDVKLTSDIRHLIKREIRKVYG